MAHLNPSTAPADLSGYFVVNVTGHRGYSFGVKSPGATEDEVIDLALSAGLFDDEKDMTEAEAIETFEHYFGGRRGELLDFSCIREDTPCGNYWN